MNDFPFALSVAERSRRAERWIPTFAGTTAGIGRLHGIVLAYRFQTCSYSSTSALTSSVIFSWL